MDTTTNKYRLLTRWRTDASIEPVWNLILHSENWPRWWKGVESVHELETGDGGLGNVRRYTWRSALGYRLRFEIKVTRAIPFTLLEGKASGDVRGWGRWHFQQAPGGTAVRYDWDVEIARPGLRLLSPIARPLFRWNHQHLMRLGARGLARELGRPVLCEAIPPGAEAK